MDQLWLVLSLTGLISGFGLLVALLFLKRLSPTTLPPVILIVVAFLLMGVSSLSGVYLRILSVPRSILVYRLINGFAWGYAVFASLYYLLLEQRHQRQLNSASQTGPLEADKGGTQAFITAIPLGLLSFILSFLAAHPATEAGLFGPLPEELKTFIISSVEILAGLLALLVGITSIRRSKRMISKPWRGFLRGFGIILLLLIPANLLDFGISVAVRETGGTMYDGFVFAAGYAVANLVLLAILIRSIRISAGHDTSLALPQQMADTFGLTKREQEIIENLLEGKTDRQIAEALFISPRTVDTHMRNIFRKCGVSSRLQLSRLVSSYSSHSSYGEIPSSE
ncbi:MAG: helix-turn-helix transcriptional regulator [Spirochaetales bacterium]|nr:helix-turn-helix transcriptional regulator [Spirochaetales bacterium]MCF7938547.1 helix-turn-helix transcriptional regulator [Spirochaetales bacterium]